MIRPPTKGSSSPDRLVQLVQDRGHLWDQAILRFEAGDRGSEEGEAMGQLAARLNLKGER